MSEEESLQIAIAEAVHGELAATDSLDQLAVIRREGLQRTHTPTMPVRGLAKSVQYLLERGVLVDAGQRIQVAFVRWLFWTPRRGGAGRRYPAAAGARLAHLEGHLPWADR